MKTTSSFFHAGFVATLLIISGVITPFSEVLASDDIRATLRDSGHPILETLADHDDWGVGSSLNDVTIAGVHYDFATSYSFELDGATIGIMITHPTGGGVQIGVSFTYMQTNAHWFHNGNTWNFSWGEPDDGFLT